jgi:hypothetical protein
MGPRAVTAVSAPPEAAEDKSPVSGERLDAARWLREGERRFLAALARSNVEDMARRAETLK